MNRIYTINAAAVKRLAAIEFSHNCDLVRHPNLGRAGDGTVNLGAEPDLLAKEAGISYARAMDFIMTAWQAEGHAVIDRWDLRAIHALTDAIPSVLPNKYRRCVIRAIDQDPWGEWVLQYDSERYCPIRTTPQEMDLT